MQINSISYVPQFILDNPDMKEILDACQLELERYFSYIETLRDQTSISYSNIYIERYEKIFGLTVNPSLSDEERIARILAKLNSSSNSTVEAVKTVVSSVTGCDTEITENYDQYTFTITVVRDGSLTFSLDAIKEAVEEIKPAHLAYEIITSWLYNMGIKVTTSYIKSAYDVCGDGGYDYDYCGEYPGISTLGIVETQSEGLNASATSYILPYSFAGEYPYTSTLGSVATTSGSIDVDTEGYAAVYDYAMEDNDYCGEEE